VRRFERDDPERLAKVLYRTFFQRVYHFCYHLCGHKTDAEDLAQEALVLACRDYHTFEGRSSVTTWLCSIALRRWRRKEVQRRTQVEVVPLCEAHESTANPMDFELDRMSLESALASLPDHLRQAFILVKEEGLKYKEAGEVLGVPQGTVQRWVHRASLRLRASLGEELLEAPESVPAAVPIRERALEVA